MSFKKASRTKSLSLSEDFPVRSPKPKNVLTASNTPAAKKPEDTAKILKYIDDNIIGKGVAFLGPFGRRKVVYADYSSSGRSLQFLEDYINKEVLPAYGDICCTSAVTGLQSSLYKNEAKEIIRTAVNASVDDEIFFFEGTNENLIERLCYMVCYERSSCKSTKGNNTEVKKPDKPVLFVSTSEPIQNLTPWINAGVKIVKISKNREGFLDLVDLEKKLSIYSESKRLLIGLFSGASRMTGMIADDVATSILLHQYNALSVWDYSAAAPFTVTDVNPMLPGADKDVIFFSTNKFIGGVQGPCVLIIKKSAFELAELKDTAGVISSVRAGLVVQLKESLGAQNICHRQEKLCKQILSHIRTIPEISLIGPSQMTSKRIPTICFLVKHPRGAFLHHRFVVAVLNDVFGIQATGGNHIGDAIGINNKLAIEYDRMLTDTTKNYEFLRPGYTRISIPYFMSEAEVAFILEALKMVATEAWKLLPQYEIDGKTGEWKHQSNSLAKERKWLGTIRYNDGRMLFSDRRISGPGAFPQNYSDCLQVARNIFNRSRKMAQKTATPYLDLKLRSAPAEILRWYMLPGEAHELLIGHSHNVKNIIPFNPNRSERNEIPSLFNMFRHNSLSALDVKRFKSRSLPTSPVQMPIRRQQSSPTPPNSPKTSNQYECVSPPVVRFSLGGEVTTMASFTPPRIASLVHAEEGVSSRNRCHSWSSADGKKSRKSENRNSVGLATHHQSTSHNAKIKQRLCSCSSQTDLFSSESCDNLLLSRAPSLHINCTQAGSNCSDCTEEIQAYVAEVTKELATEIKSEIREVISKVEDVLESTDTMDMSSINMSSLTNYSTCDDLRSDSVSATDVAEYLKEFSKEMASEVKSEIREAVSAMTDIMPSENSNNNNYRKNSPPEINTDTIITTSTITTSAKNDNNRNDIKLIANHYNHHHHRFSGSPNSSSRDLLDDVGKSHRTEIFSRPNSTSGWHQPTAPSPESSTPTCPYTGAISKLVDPISTASQDSGINMCFHDQDEIRSRTVSEGISDAIKVISRRSQSDSAQGDCDKIIETPVSINHNNFVRNIERIKRTSSPIKREFSPSNHRHQQQITKRQPSESDSDKDLNKFHHLPKDVWKQTAEAIDEFDMLRDGDRVLVCLSGTSASLCLLHALRQFSRARGIHIEMGAISVGKCGVDPRALMLYLRDINIDLFMEQLGPSENYKSRICSLARRKNYNVLAMGNTLDKLANEFLISVIHKGKLHAIPAHCTTREGDIRIIRPFIFVRERLLEDFAVYKCLPTRLSSTLEKPLDASNSILKVQEIINPDVFENIKNGLRPLLAVRRDTTKISYDFFALLRD